MGIELAYLAAALAFIFGLKGMCHPRTARAGNALASLGMLIAAAATLTDQRIVEWDVIAAGLGTGGVIGAWMAWRAPLTAMPQVVAVFNGFGGGASALAVGAVLEESAVGTTAVPALQAHEAVAAAVSGLIGGLALTGSAVAFGKLQGWLRDRPILVPGRHVWNLLMALGCLALAGWDLSGTAGTLPFWCLVGLAGALGVGLVLPIGGADMPVVISLLNAYSGLAAAGFGWVLGNSVLLIAGSMVAAAGFLLTALMCQAMNRSLRNVMFAGVGAATGGRNDSDFYAGHVMETTPTELADLLAAARRAVIVPGYGLAAAQAQHLARDLARALEARGAVVEFAVHPVAGRMPGHLNVLLAEADIPYDQLRDLEAMKGSWPDVDVVLVVGANDVVNPSARDADPANPLAGMPILDVDRANVVVVLKRSLSPGFAGVPNPLFRADNTLMLFGDAKETLGLTIRELARA